ncbi:unnamed protein product [Effrenium voratum]|uniref:Fe2OG dioxygenase domain-containing protein n=1 Tax=Effrenium voratum TaxID=2562239 RepID=A0AA36I1S0_9DINO|nr:unnamed protein product [Effrenium voratum]CAJ1425481.1 unnamed protein product [Effrenium voratum]
MPRWRITGGADKGGLIVREGAELGSRPLGRVSTGALVEQLGTEGARLHYRLLVGCGPVEGWISTRLDQRPLAELDVEPGVEPSAMAEDLSRILKSGTKHAPAGVCPEGDLQLFEKLQLELGKGQRNFSGRWRPQSEGKWKTPWRNGLGSEQVETSDGEKLPLLAQVLRRLEEVANAEMLQWWANLYEDGSVGCEFHHDGHAEWHITAGASFGAARKLTFQHEASGAERSFLQRNGDIFAFDHHVDEAFMHGVYPVEEELGPRISVIIMGRSRGKSIHSCFAQEQVDHRNNFARDCLASIERLRTSIDSQEAALRAKEPEVETLPEGELLLDAGWELRQQKSQADVLVAAFLDANAGRSVKLQEGISLMKRQQSLLADLKELSVKQDKLLWRRARALANAK